MLIKCIKEDEKFNYYLQLNKPYSVIRIEIYLGSDPEKEKISFICVNRLYLETYLSFHCYTTSNKYFEVLSDLIPTDWTVYFWNDFLFVEPEAFEDLWGDFYDDRSLHIFRKESLKIIAFDSQKDMKGFVAEEILTYIKEEGYDPEKLNTWSKNYQEQLSSWTKILESDFFEEMYGEKMRPDVKTLLEDLTLYDWNPDLAIPEQELIERLTKYSEEGTLQNCPKTSLQEILNKYIAEALAPLKLPNK